MQVPDHDPRSHTCFLNIKVEFKVSSNEAMTRISKLQSFSKQEMSIRLDYRSYKLCNSL